MKHSTLLTLLLAVSMCGFVKPVSAHCPELTKPLWTVTVERRPPLQRKVVDCDYLGVWDGTGHYNCRCRDRKPAEKVCYQLISYPLKGYFSCRPMNLYIPKELQ